MNTSNIAYLRDGVWVATLVIRSIIGIHLIGVIVQVTLGTTSAVRLAISIVSSIVGIALVGVIVVMLLTRTLVLLDGDACTLPMM